MIFKKIILMIILIISAYLFSSIFLINKDIETINSEKKIDQIVTIATQKKSQDYQYLIQYLDDDDVGVKTTAAQWMYQLNDPVFYPTIIDKYSKILTRLKYVKNNPLADYDYAIKRGVSVMGLNAVPYLISLLNDNKLKPRSRAKIAWHLGHLITKEGLVAESRSPLLIGTLLNLLRDPAWMVRLRAAGSLGRAGLDDGYEIAVDALTHSGTTSYDRVIASWALAFIGKEEGIKLAIPSAIKELENPPSLSTYAEGIHALSNLCSKAELETKKIIVKKFVSFLKDEETAGIRRVLVRALGTCKDISVFDYLVFVMKYDPSGNVRFQAAQAFWRWEYQPAAPYLIDALNDPYVETRKWSLNALRKLDLSESMKVQVSEMMEKEPDLALKKKYKTLLKNEQK